MADRFCFIESVLVICVFFLLDFLPLPEMELAHTDFHILGSFPLAICKYFSFVMDL